jgi:ferrous iron transport protein B
MKRFARDVLLGLREDTPVPDAVIVVVDASNLERNLYLATQVLDLGLPTIVLLNMSDVARANNKPVDAAQLSRALGTPVVESVASRGEGLDALKRALTQPIAVPQPPALTLPPAMESALSAWFEYSIPRVRTRPHAVWLCACCVAT